MYREVSSMSYLIYTEKKQLLLINHSVKNGLYSQTLSSSGISRPLTIHRNPTSEYSATIDHNYNLHIITKPSPDQVTHLHYKDNNLRRNIILEDPKGIYHFSNLHLLSSKDHVHLFYTANQPIGDSRDLLHHILCLENKIEPCPIMSLSPNNLGFRYMSYNNTIYVLYGDLATEYSLYLMTYKNNQWTPASLISASSFPIDDFQFCIDYQGTMHLIYVQEKYGRYHLIYKKNQNNSWSDETLLYTTSSSIYPSIFSYHQGIWITYKEDNELQMVLSMDGGNKFSQNVKCSLQEGNLKRCHFVSAPDSLPDSFNGNILYAFLIPSIRIGVICQLDMVGLHPDMIPNTELELFLDGIFYSLSQNPAQLASPTPSPDVASNLATLKEENEELKKIQQHMIDQYNDMAELTKKIQEEGKKWRSKALDLQEAKSQDPS